MSNDRLDVKVVSNQNSVELTKNENTVVVSDKKRDTSISVLQKETAVVTVASKGPKGDRGDKGDPGVNSINNQITTGSITASVNVGADTFKVQSGSSTFLYISSSGNIGIGTTSPTNTLQVNGGITATSITGSLLGTSSWAQSASNAINAQTASFLPIGTYSITSSQTITAQTASFLPIGTYSITSSQAITAQTASFLPIGTYSITSSQAITAQTASNITPSITNNTNNNVLTATGGGTINGETNLTFDGSTLQLYTNNLSTNAIIVGTDSSILNHPDTSSVVIGGINAHLDLYNPNSSVAADQLIGAIRFRNNDTPTFSVTKAQIAAYTTDTTPDGYLVFSTQQNASPSGLAERMRITNTGLVGIGTTSPTERLHVDGNMVVTGRITAEEFHTEFVSASIIYQSGSTQFGNSLDDTHIFTGSLNITGSLTVNGKTIDESINSASVSYVSQSGDIYSGLNQIEVQDFSDDVAVTWVNGRLKFIFGSPTLPSSITLTLSGFSTDRFNQVLDGYDVSGSWSNGGYNIISASLYTGSVLLTSTTSGTSLSTSLTTSGSQSYSLQYTASSPLDGSIFSGSASATGTLSKSNPGSPTLTLTPSVQLGGSSNQIERGATGSISFTSASGDANGWVLNFVSTNFNSPYFVTGSATGSASIPITATAYYSSSGVNGSDNNPALTTTTSTTTTYTKIVSLRHGAASDASFTEAQLDNLSGWDTTLGGSIGTIVKGTVNPSGQSVTINWTGDKYHYIVYSGSRSNLTNITTSGFGVLGSFTVSTVGNYKVYRTTTLQAGGAGSSITYVLT